MERLTRQFRVRNAKGVKLNVLEFQTFREFRTVRGTRMMPGRKRFMLDTGEEAEPLDVKTFAVIATGGPLRRVKPDSGSE